MSRRSNSRQFSLLSHKPTHFRVKTQSDQTSNYNTTKHPTFKNSLLTSQFKEFQKQLSEKLTNQTIIPKKSPAQRSVFGQIKLHMPKPKKQNISQIQTEHPLKEYIKTQKENQARRIVKRYKTSCGFSPINKKIQRKNKTILPFRKLDLNCMKEVSKQRQILYGLVDQIYKKIQKFKQVGFTEKKINEWIQKYCTNKRNYMTDLLMRPQTAHKFTEKTMQDYFYQRDPQRVKQKLRFVKKKINNKDRFIDQFDLVEFSNYIEEILVQKNKAKLDQLRDSISQKLQECFVYNRQRNEYQFGKKLYPPELLNFVSDMNEAQKKYGDFSKVSIFNREYFVELGNAQRDIRTKIYEMIKVTQGHSNIKHLRELTKSSTVKLDKKFNRGQKLKTLINNTIEVTDFEEQ